MQTTPGEPTPTCPDRPPHRDAACRGLLSVVTIVLFAACGTDAGSSGATLDTFVETIGDTTVVRTLSGSVWGAEATLVPEVSIGELDGPEEYLFGRIWSIAVNDDGTVYVLDQQAQHVRVFDSLGVYLETLGRRGEGPGEFTRAEAIAVLPDGRLIVRDPGNQRVTVFGPGPGETAEWRYNASTYTLSPLYTDTRGRTYLLAGDLSRVDDFAMQIIVLGPDGTPLDTLPEPSSDYVPPFVRAEERSRNPVAALDEERAYQRERTVGGIRRSIPDWDWDGPAIPSHKPFFHELLAGRDGRIWVRLSTEGRPVDNDDHDPDDPGSFPVTWEEETRYDVFEPDGTYLGVVGAPDGFSRFPAPVFDSDHVWAVTEDGQGVERVVRYRIRTGRP